MGILRSPFSGKNHETAEEIDLDARPESSRKPPETSPQRASGKKTPRRTARKGPITLADLNATSEEIRGQAAPAPPAVAAAPEVVAAPPEADDDPEEAIDPDELVDVPPSDVPTPVDSITRAFPGAQVVDKET